MKKVKIISPVEMKNMLLTNRLHEALKDSVLEMSDIEAMCLNMYKMGISPLTTIKKYLGKYDLNNIEVVFVDGERFGRGILPPVVVSKSQPVLLVILELSADETPVMVKVMYHSTSSKDNVSKYKLINFFNK